MRVGRCGNLSSQLSRSPNARRGCLVQRSLRNRRALSPQSNVRAAGARRGGASAARRRCGVDRRRVVVAQGAVGMACRTMGEAARGGDVLRVGVRAWVRRHAVGCAGSVARRGRTCDRSSRGARRCFRRRGRGGRCRGAQRGDGPHFARSPASVAIERAIAKRRLETTRGLLQC